MPGSQESGRGRAGFEAEKRGESVLMIGAGLLSCLFPRRRFGSYRGPLTAGGGGPFGLAHAGEGKEPLL